MLQLIISIILIGLVAHTDGLEFVSQSWKIPNAPPGVPAIKFVNLGTTIKVSCKTDDPKAKVVLHASNRSGQRNNMLEWHPKRVTKNGQTFTIRNIHMRDGMEYFCQARTDRELVELRKGRLIVRNVQANLIPEIYPYNQQLAIERKGQYTLTCKTRGASKGVKSFLTWYFKQEGSKTEVRVSPSRIESSKKKVGRNHIDVEKVVFKNFSRKDVGEYICRRKIPGEIIETSKSLQVRMKADEAPRAKVSALNLMPRENETIILRCDATGSPKPQRFWTAKDGKVIHCENNSLPCLYVIARVQFPRDDGIAKCTAINDVGADVQQIVVKVQVPVTFKTNYRSSIIGRSNEQVELKMDVLRGNPAPKITWYQHKCKSKWYCQLDDISWMEVENQMPDNNAKTMSSFILTPKTSSDYWYRVVATNSAGTKNFTFQLIRKEDHIPQFAILPDVKVHEILSHEYLTIKCVIDTDVYSHEVKFTKDGVSLKYDKVSKGKSRVMVFHKENVSIKDSGVYECFARSKNEGNRFRKRSILVKVRSESTLVKEKEEKVVTSPSVEELKEKIIKLTQELNDLRRIMKNNIIYVTDADGNKIAAKQIYKEFNASFIGIGAGLDSYGKSASATSSTIFVYNSLTDCLEHCADKRVNEPDVNGVHYSPENGECQCERNFVTHKSGANKLHYRLQ